MFTPDNVARGSLGRIGHDPNAVSWRNFLCKSSHPLPAFFHIAFKSAALLLYILCVGGARAWQGG